MTAEELAELDASILRLIHDSGYTDRLDNPETRPEGARPISMMIFGIPAPPPGS
jgi:hypothetical protein